jgi:uncharacterized protein (TIGR02217 family)
MAFIEVEFPRKLALGAVGGPMYSTQVNIGFSGYEQRNQNWSQSRGAWTVSFENKPQSEYQGLLGFFHAVKGQANGFRLFDPTDNTVVGGFIGTGDGTTATFQLQKVYQFPLTANQVIRPVQKVITSKVTDFYGNLLPDTLNVYVNGVLQAHNAGYIAGGGAKYTFDETTGVITFTGGNIPAAAAVITADFQFHWPVRFDLDALQTQFLTPNTGAGPIITVTGMKLVEVRIQVGSSG